MQEYIILYNSILRLFGKINARCVAWAADNDRGFHPKKRENARRAESFKTRGPLINRPARAEQQLQR